MATKVIKHNGKDVQGTVVNYDIVAENWQVYDLADGSTMRVKNTLVEVVRVNSEHNANGDPVYACTFNTIVNFLNIPDHLKKPAGGAK